MNYRDDETDEEFMARRPTVVMFHGNGGNLGHRIPLAMVFQQFLRLNVLMVSYRGCVTVSHLHHSFADFYAVMESPPEVLRKKVSFGLSLP